MTYLDAVVDKYVKGEELNDEEFEIIEKMLIIGLENNKQAKKFK